MWYSQSVGALRSRRGFKRLTKAYCQSSSDCPEFRVSAHSRCPLKAKLGGINPNTMSSSVRGNNFNSWHGESIYNISFGARLFNGPLFFLRVCLYYIHGSIVVSQLFLYEFLINL